MIAVIIPLTSAIYTMTTLGLRGNTCYHSGLTTAYFNDSSELLTHICYLYLMFFYYSFIPQALHFHCYWFSMGT